MTRRNRVSFVLQEAEDGGVDRCFLNLARGFIQRGVEADLLVRNLPKTLLALTDPAVNLIRLGPSTRQLTPLLRALTEHRKPAALMAAKDSDARLALALGRRLKVPAVLVASLDHSGQLDGRNAGRLRRWLRFRELRRLYGQADHIICVSQGVAEDMAHILGGACPPISILPNPVITPEFENLAAQPLDHPWFARGEPPVILGVGRLSLIKNFPLLVRAFARVHPDTGTRLVILGEGKQRTELLRLGEQLGVGAWMDLPGHVANPYPYMARSALFVLSSLWEGFGNVLVEALACGTPVVATDCRSGPAQILESGRFGALVPVNDPQALADAIVNTLNNRLPADFLKQAATPYTLNNSVEAYLSALGLTPQRDSAPDSH